MNENPLKKKILGVIHDIRLLCVVLMCFVSVGLLNAQTITGTVTDQQKDPLTGVSVVEKGTSNGVATNIDGKYSLTVKNSNATLVFHFLGYRTVEIALNGRTSLDLILDEDTQLLDEVVVVGYGTQKKVNLTGSISSLSSETFEAKPVSNIGQAIQGLVPNLNVSITNGSPGTVPGFNIRGGTTIAYDKDTKKYEINSGTPLILIDNIEAGNEYLNMLNPNDIESFVTIKDASAAAIYGTRATNGVILVTTKSGKKNQKARVNYTYDMRWNTPSATPDILDSHTQYLAGIYSNNLHTWAKRDKYKELANDEQRYANALLKYQQNPTPENAWYYELEGNPDSKVNWVANMNPFKTLIRDWTPIQQHNVSVSGGGSSVSYYISLGYNDQEGFYKIGNDEFKQYNMLSNFDIKMSDRLSVGAKVSYTRSIYDTPYMVSGKGKIWSALLNEVDRNIRMPLRTSMTDPVPNVPTDNIISWMTYGSKEKTTKESYFLTVSPSFKVMPGLTLKSDFSFRPGISKIDRFVPENPHIEGGTWTIKTTQTTNGNEVRKYNKRSNLYTINLYADFEKKIANKHTVSGVIGFNQESYEEESSAINAKWVVSKDVPAVDISTKAEQGVEYDATEWATRAAFGRINYNFDDRYLFEVNGRYDGSSRFSKDERFKFFPSYSAGWRISEEPFLKESTPWLNNLKLRVGYGSLGAQPESDYPFSAVLGTSDGNYFMGGKSIVAVKAPSKIYPKKLKWETRTSFDPGIDITVLNRLDATIEWFEKRTKDILMPGKEYPSQLSAEAPLVNAGELKTYGWEFSLKWYDKLSNGLRYDLTLSLADAQSEVVSYPGNEETKKFGELYRGLKYGTIWGYVTDRILQEDDFEYVNNKWVLKNPIDQASISGSNLLPGDVIYKDQNEDGKINNGANTLGDHGDLVKLGNSTPRYKYAVIGNIQYKGFDLNLFFQGVAKRDSWIGTDKAAYRPGTSNAGSWYMYNNSWTPENPGAKFPTYGQNGNNWQTQSAYLVNSSYFRLKQAVLGYSIPPSVLKKAKIDKLRVFVSGYNLFEITNVPNVFDPDLISADYPSMRSVSVGVQLGF